MEPGPRMLPRLERLRELLRREDRRAVLRAGSPRPPVPAGDAMSAALERAFWRKDASTRVPVVVVGRSLLRIRVLVAGGRKAAVRSVKRASLEPRADADPIDAIAEAWRS